MNNGFAQFWLFLAVSATLFHSGLGIRCYQCSSLRDPRCKDPVSEGLRPVECTAESVTTTMTEISYAVRGRPNLGEVFSRSPITCLKISSQYSTQSSNMTYVRGCYYDIVDGKDICTVLRGKLIDQKNLPYCGTCMGDACNGSHRIASTSTLLTVLLPFVAYYAVFH